MAVASSQAPWIGSIVFDWLLSARQIGHQTAMKRSAQSVQGGQGHLCFRLILQLQLGQQAELNSVWPTQSSPLPFNQVRSSKQSTLLEIRGKPQGAVFQHPAFPTTKALSGKMGEIDSLR